MKMIPSYLEPKVKSSAEKRLFQEFKKITCSGNYVCLHSVNLPDHIYKIFGEIDFIILSSRGLFVLEVKGGGITCENGIWYYEDRNGIIHHSSEGPFTQARSAMFSLKKRLVDIISEDELKDLVMGFGVAFPDCPYTVDSIEWDQEMVLDSGQMSSEKISRYINRLEQYWHLKMPNRPQNISDDLLKIIIQYLRPSFELVRSLSVQADEIDARLVSLTEEQSSRLDIIEHYPRILIEGSAGTGKTFLALEEFHRQSAEGKKTLLICFSPILVSFLKSRNSSPSNNIFSVHELMLQHTRNFGNIPVGYTPGMSITDPWFCDVLAPAFSIATTNLPDEKKWDVLIIDEGQDILNINYLNGLDGILKGGLTEGYWRVYYDPNNQSAIYGEMDDEVLEFLSNMSPVVPKLTINCRNTNPIVTQTKLFTGSDLAVKSTGTGPIVEYDFYETKKQAVELLEDSIRKLKNQGCDDSEITILSPVKWDLSAASMLIPRYKNIIKVLKGSQKDLFPFPGITFCSVAEFKGLENRYIILIDIDDLDSTVSSQAILYVGMTRARVKLMILMNKQLEQHLNKVVESNFKRISKDK